MLVLEAEVKKERLYYYTNSKIDFAEFKQLWKTQTKKFTL